MNNTPAPAQRPPDSDATTPRDAEPDLSSGSPMRGAGVALPDPTLHRISSLAHAGELAPASRKYVWYVTALLSVVNVFNYMDRMALSVLLPYIRADLHLSDSQLGLLVGLAFSVFYAIFGIPIAMWADRGTRRNIIALALATWSIMTSLCGAAQNFWQLFTARMGVGIGEAGSLPPSQSIICDYVPLNRRAGAFAVNQFGQVVGIMFGMGLAGWLGAVIGWRWAFVVLGLPGVLLALIIRFTLREPVRGRYDSDSARQLTEKPLSAMRSLWHCRTYKLLIVFMMTNGFVQFGLNLWWPSFYARAFNVEPMTIGVSLGIAIGVGSGIGVLLGGLLANKVGQKDVRFPLMLAGIPALLALPTALATLLVPSFAGCIALVMLTGVLWAVPGGPVVAAVFSVTTPAARATAGAITILFTSIIGIGFGPLTVGLLSDALAASLGTDSLRYALFIPVAAHPILTIAAFAAAKALPKDLEALRVRLGAAAQGSDDATRAHSSAH